MTDQDRVDRTLLYHLWHKHPTWTIRQFAETLKRSLTWVRTWLARFRAAPDSPTLLLDRSHARPDTLPHTTPQLVMETILAMRDHPPENLRRVPGPKAILYYLARAQHLADVALPRSTRTIWRILKAAGRIVRSVRAHQERLERPDPMGAWQMDFKDVTTVPADPDGKRRHVVETLNLIDVGSDVLVGAHVRDDFTAATVLPALVATFAAAGLPEQLRLDRDTRFVGSAQQGDFPSALIKLLLCLEVQPVICDPHRPDQNGVVERYHRSYQEECLAVEQPRSLAAARDVTAVYQAHYNHERPNQAVVCGNRPPAVAHPALPRRRSLPTQVDPDAWLAAIDGLRYRRKVQADTSISIANQRYYTRADLVGQSVTVRVAAATQELVVESAGREVRRVAIQGLHGTGPVTLERLLDLRVAEASREPPPRHGAQGAATRGRGKAERWIDRVNQAGLRTPDRPAAAAPPAGGTAAPTGADPAADAGDIPF